MLLQELLEDYQSPQKIDLTHDDETALANYVTIDDIILQGSQQSKWVYQHVNDVMNGYVGFEEIQKDIDKHITYTDEQLKVFSDMFKSEEGRTKIMNNMYKAEKAHEDGSRRRWANPVDDDQPESTEKNFDDMTDEEKYHDPDYEEFGPDNDIYNMANK